MDKIKNFKGAGTALVTPFKKDGSVDEHALRKLVSRQIEDGIDFLVPCGTTGESPTLKMDEHLRVIEVVVQEAEGRVPVLGGAGSNDTHHVIEMAHEVKRMGVDGILSVTPYYNKPTQDGLIAHFSAIAKEADLPIIVYNVPGRTSVNIQPATVKRLSEVDNIVGIKEASGDLGQVADIANLVDDDFIILSGDDALTLPILSLGGVGVISVMSNLTPGLMSQLVKHYLNSEYAEALAIHRNLYRLMNLNFIETSPVPVKTGLALMGLVEERFRLPLVQMHDSNKKLLEAEMRMLKLI